MAPKLDSPSLFQGATVAAQNFAVQGIDNVFHNLHLFNLSASASDISDKNFNVCSLGMKVSGSLFHSGWESKHQGHQWLLLLGVPNTSA
jgi:hypothetical protein